jgi:putative DNA primase/helicase
MLIEFEAKARDAMAGYGLMPPQIVFDGKIHKFDDSPKHKNKAQFYVLHADSVSAWGAFGDFRCGIFQSFSSKSQKEMSQTEKLEYKKKQEAIKRQYEKDKRESAQKAIDKAAKMLDTAQLKPHPYTKKKQVKQYAGTGVYRGAFVIPLYSDKELKGAQIIAGDGVKRFVTGTQKKGAYFPIGDFKEPSVILVAEGYATAASLHEATRKPCVVAFDAYNLFDVGRSIRKAFPRANIIFCADNDDSETGIKKANEAATACKGIVRLCPINSDFNDLHVQQGLDAVRECIFKPKPQPVYISDDNYESPKPNKMPFRILGRADNKCYYMPSDGQIYSHAPHSHNKQVLLAIAPLDFWCSMFSDGKGGFSVDESVDWLLRQSERLTYNQYNVRGRGAWIDTNGIIIHQGEEVLETETGETFQSDEYESRFLYPRKASINYLKATPISDAESNQIYNIFSNIPTETMLQRQLLAGWVVCSQLSGILDWRPHIWLTGAKSTGKSWVMSKIIKPLMGENMLFVQSSTTEAGIRQALGADALPVLFDEAEGNTERSRGNIQRVLELARQASSNDGGVIAKGTMGGEAMRFHIRSCFCFSSIIDGVVQNSDKSRITPIEINKDRYGSDEQFSALSSLKSLLTDDFCAGFYWRVIGMADTIKHNAGLLSDVVGRVVDDSRAGEQLGNLLAGLYSLMSSRKMTKEQVELWVNNFDLTPYKTAYAEQDDGTACLSAIMACFIEHDDKRRNVGDLLEQMTSISMYDDKWQAINKSLCAKGLRVTDDHRLCIANSHEGLKQLLMATPYAVGWDKVLNRATSAMREKNPIRFGGVKVRAVSVDLKLFFTD